MRRKANCPQLDHLEFVEAESRLVMAARVKVNVWDWGVRLSHWAMVALVLVGWMTGEEEGVAREIHRYSGEALAGVLVFRLVWGFVGGEHARFSSFLRGPGAVRSHLRDLAMSRAHQTLGHNALGGWASMVLWAAVAATVATGLMSLAEQGVSGPLAGPLGVNMADFHEVAFRVLQVLVVLHLLGVALTSLASKDNLVFAMITGAKPRRQEEMIHDARSASPFAGLASVVSAAFVSLMLMLMPHPIGQGEQEDAAQGQLGRFPNSVDNDEEGERE